GRCHSCARKMRHEIEVEGQLFRRQPLVECQHVAAFVGGKKVVRVLYTCHDGIEGAHGPQRVTRQPGGEIVWGDGGVDRHLPASRAASTAIFDEDAETA